MNIENIPEFLMAKFNEDCFFAKVLSFEKIDFDVFVKYKIYYELKAIIGIYECTEFKKTPVIDYKDNYMLIGEMKKLLELSKNM